MEDYKITDLQILGMEAGKIPFPKWLHRYEDKPLFTYRVFMKYQGHHSIYRKKVFSGRCALILKTSVNNREGLATLNGNIFLKRYSLLDLPSSNFVPKQKIECQQLNDYVASFIASGWGLGSEFFNYDTFGNIENELFSCRLEEIPLVNINTDTLDMVSVNMDLFKPI